MLSIDKIALGQHRYYERQVAGGADDYYSGRCEAPGHWIGAGANALGLSGRVSAEQFTALIAGLDPRDPPDPHDPDPSRARARVRSSSQDPKVAAFDLTFSAPKSISVLFAIAPEHISGQLIACHEESVRAALDYLQDTAVMVRRGHAGEHIEQAQGLIAAAYRHRMSRALDPQLHTHVVAANLAQGQDGRYTALHGTPLYKAAKTAGTLYQAHLRALVSERLGLEWAEVHNGAAELAQVPQPVNEHFSKRRHEMQEAALAGGISLETKAGAQSAALATRERKQYGLETHTWRQEIRARAAELGLGTRELQALLAAGQERVQQRLARAHTRAPARGQPSTKDNEQAPTAGERALSDHLAGPKGLTERANTFDQRPVLQEFASAATQGALVPEVRAQAQRFTQRADVIPTTQAERGTAAFTTAELISCERALIAAAVGRGSEQTAILDPALVDRALAKADRPLTTEQGAAVRAITTSGHGVDVIQALAGTGKTYTAGVLGGVFQAAGHRVLGVAPTGRAARELTEEAGVQARTLDRLLNDLDQLGDELPAGCVVILDEAGMAPTRASARLLEAAERAQAKLIAIGDPGQLASVQAGGWLSAVGRQLGVVRLTEVMRQRDQAERSALGALHDHQPERYLEWAQRAGRIETFGDAASARKHALAEWASALQAVGPAQAVMIARDNDTRGALNQAAREHRRELGQLGALGQERSYGQLPLAVGDRVISRRNDRRLDVDNGMRGTVRRLDDERVVIDTASGQTRELPARYAAEHLEHAYALTGHGMQGATVESATVLASPQDLTAGWSYTALSRARGQTQLLIHDEQFSTERSDFAPDQPATPTRESLLARAQRRMLKRDDEDLAVEQLPAPERLPAPAARKLQRLEDLQAKALTLTTQREQLATRLAELPQPQRRFGRERDWDAVQRANLSSALRASERELAAVLAGRERLERNLGGPGEIRALREAQLRAQAELHRGEPAHDQRRRDDGLRRGEPEREAPVYLGR